MRKLIIALALAAAPASAEGLKIEVEGEGANGTIEIELMEDVAPGHAKRLAELWTLAGKSENAATAYMAGRADPHTVVEALASAELAVETAVTLRNKVVEAYQELMRMPV